MADYADLIEYLREHYNAKNNFLITFGGSYLFFLFNFFYFFTLNSFLGKRYGGM